MIKSLMNRAMSALTPRSDYQREVEGRRIHFKQEQARVKANRQKVRAALARGDKAEALRLTQPGAADTQQSTQAQRLAALYAADDAQYAQVSRNLETLKAEIAAAQAAPPIGEVRVQFLDDGDATRYRRLIDADKFREAREFLQERIASGYAVETVLP